MRDSKNTTFLIGIGLFVLALVIRLLGISETTLQHDEPFTLFVSQFPLSSIVDLAKDENNPIGHFIFMKYWTQLFGFDAFAARLPSTLFGAVSVMTLYFIGRRFLNQIGSISASLFCLFSNLHVFHSHEARVYALSFFLTTAAVLGIVYIHKRKWYIIPMISLAIGLNLYMHFTSIIVVGMILFTSIVLYSKDRRLLKKSLLSIFLGSVLFLPYVGILFTRWTSSQGGTWVSKPGSLETIYNILREFLNSPVASVCCLILIAMGVFLVIKRRILKKSLLIFLAWWLFAALGLFAVSYVVPMYLSRYILFCSVGLYLLIGLATQMVHDIIPNQWLKYLSIVPLIIFIGSFKLVPGPDRSNKEDLLTLNQNQDAETAIVLIPSYLGIHYVVHFEPGIMTSCKEQHDFIAPLTNQGIYCVNSLADFQKLTKGNNFKSVLYFDGWDELVDPEHLLIQDLESNFKNQDKISDAITKFH